MERWKNAWNNIMKVTLFKEFEGTRFIIVPYLYSVARMVRDSSNDKVVTLPQVEYEVRFVLFRVAMVFVVFLILRLMKHNWPIFKGNWAVKILYWFMCLVAMVIMAAAAAPVWAKYFALI